LGITIATIAVSIAGRSIQQLEAGEVGLEPTKRLDRLLRESVE